MIEPPAPVLQVVRDQRVHYERLVSAVERYAAVGDVERVLRWAMLAGNYAWLAPVGRLADPRLERLVVDAVRGSGRAVVDGGRDTGRVLHVLSESYGTGGHTRLAARWITRDPRPADLALTHQRGEVPPALVDAVTTAGGRVHQLSAGTPALLDRVHALRALMDRADVVVMHVHPHDSVALAAVNLPGLRPPVVLEQHCDHMFWLGVGAADVVCDLRTAARFLDTGMRGVPEQRVALLPMPVDQLASPRGAELRGGFGFPADAVVALTVSGQDKMSATSGRGFADLLGRTLNLSPRLCAVVVGTEPGAEWDRLTKRFPRRVAIVGRVPDPAPYFAAADLYLDSYPCHSATSALEAAVTGLPVVALVDSREDDPAHMLQAASPGLSDRLATGTAEQFAVAVRRLVMDADLRRSAGATMRAAALAQHDGPGWSSQLEALYARARSLPAVDLDEIGPPPVDDRYGAVLHQLHNRRSTGTAPEELTAVLGTLFDDAMAADLVALSHDQLDAPVTVRVRLGWEAHPLLATRLLVLAAEHPRLSVSLPFTAGDDRDGTSTSAVLHELLAAAGLTADTCGTVSVDTARPARAAISIAGELPMLAAALDWLELLISSPFWARQDAELVGS